MAREPFRISDSDAALEEACMAFHAALLMADGSIDSMRVYAVKAARSRLGRLLQSQARAQQAGLTPIFGEPGCYEFTATRDDCP
jgi:hypothetical protein